MVYYIQIDRGALIPVSGIKKAQERAKFLLRKLPAGATVWLVTAKTRSEVMGGWGTKKQLKVNAVQES